MECCEVIATIRYPRGSIFRHLRENSPKSLLVSNEMYGQNKNQSELTITANEWRQLARSNVDIFTDA